MLRRSSVLHSVALAMSVASEKRDRKRWAWRGNGRQTCLEFGLVCFDEDRQNRLEGVGYHGCPSLLLPVHPVPVRRQRCGQHHDVNVLLGSRGVAQAVPSLFLALPACDD